MSHHKYEFAVICTGTKRDGEPTCGLVPLTYEQYIRQMDAPDEGWKCPKCGSIAEWDGYEGEDEE